MLIFKLEQEFVDGYKAIPPDFGFNGLGLLTFYRTYSRLKDDGTNEQWYETVRRVVEGCYSLQKEHVLHQGLGWKENKAQKSAQEMYDRIFKMKFLPPGRMLWALGTPIVHERKIGQALFNCAFVSTEEIGKSLKDAVKPFLFMFDMSMTGCIAEGEWVMTSDGPIKIEELQGKAFKAIVDGKEYDAPKGSWLTGNKEVVLLKTSKGHSVKLTEDHRVQKVRKSRTHNNKVVEHKEWVSVGELNIGDFIKLNNHREYEWKGVGTLEEGYLAGAVLGDGWIESHLVVASVHYKDSGHEGTKDYISHCISTIARRDIALMWRDRDDREHSRITVGSWINDYLTFTPKAVKDSIERSSSDFYKGFIGGMFDADGSVLVKKKEDYNITLSQANLQTIELIQRMLLRLGIQSSINKKKKAGVEIIMGRTCNIKASYTLIIAGDDIPIFAKEIGFKNTEKKNKLETIIKEKIASGRKFVQKRFMAKVVSKEVIGNLNVYDISVPEVEQFDANGFVVHNCGIGWDPDGAGLIKIHTPSGKPEKFVIPDSREGWVESLEHLLNSYFGKHFETKSHPVEFDYSLIRPAGVPLKGFGGISSGPTALVKLHDQLKEVLNLADGKTITITNIADIMNMIGQCVVAGGIRRTAQVSLGPVNSEEYRKLKDYKWNAKAGKYEGTMAHRSAWGWASNNSVFVDNDSDFTEVGAQTGLNGEPGYAFLNNMREFSRMCDLRDYKDAKAKGANPCMEQTLFSWELCCLQETFPSRAESKEDFVRTLKFAYLLGKTATLATTTWKETNRVQKKNRRIGTSVTGITDFLEKNSLETLRVWLDEGYKEIQKWDEVYSSWFGIPRSIKTTSVKPSGSVSLLAGVNPGCHFPEFEYYIRRVRVSKLSKLIPPIKASGLHIEEDVIDNSSFVVEFPIHNKGKNLSQVTLWEQVALAAFLQRWWADNQVSNTSTFRPEEASQIPIVLDYFKHDLKAISFLPKLELGAYAQMPYEAITKERYEKLMKGIRPIKFTGVGEDVQAERGCDGEKCVI